MKYSKKKVRRICDFIEAGNTIQDACELAGISRAAYYQWRNAHEYFKDEIEKSMDRRGDLIAEKASSGLLKLVDTYTFEERTVEKNASGQVVSEKVTTKIIMPHHNAVRFALERLNPDRFADKKDLPAGGELEQPDMLWGGKPVR